MLDQLKHKGGSLANRCFFLCEEEETVEHLLVHYQTPCYFGVFFFFWLKLA